MTSLVIYCHCSKSSSGSAEQNPDSREFYIQISEQPTKALSSVCIVGVIFAGSGLLVLEFFLQTLDHVIRAK